MGAGFFFIGTLCRDLASAGAFLAGLRSKPERFTAFAGSFLAAACLGFETGVLRFFDSCLVAAAAFLTATFVAGRAVTSASFPVITACGCFAFAFGVMSGGVGDLLTFFATLLCPTGALSGKAAATRSEIS
jgi:hypothetical protein